MILKDGRIWSFKDNIVMSNSSVMCPPSQPSLDITANCVFCDVQLPLMNECYYYYYYQSSI